MNKKIVQKIIVDNPPKNVRLDIYLSDVLGITRSSAQKYIKDQMVMVNNLVATPKLQLSSGDVIQIFKPELGTTPVVPIIFQDKDILVIDKPAGISTHPAPGETGTTLSEIFSYIYKDVNETGRDHIVHRLDKGTSGVMVLAKNKNSKDFISEQFSKRGVNKKYEALVRGKLLPKEGVIDMPLTRDLFSRNKISPVEGGREAKTIYSVIKYFQEYTLVELLPKTGRTHQIRVHMAAIGHPLYGDERYGGKRKGEDMIFLHAKEISFLHPKTGQRVKFVSEMPNNLKEVISNLN